MVKKIGILGSGIVGQTLANSFIKHGYKVMLGTRDSSKLEGWKEKAGDKSSIGDFEETAKFGEILVLAVKGIAAKEALQNISAENTEGKTIIDATNPIADAPPQNGVLKFFTSLDES